MKPIYYPVGLGEKESLGFYFLHVLKSGEPIFIPPEEFEVLDQEKQNRSEISFGAKEIADMFPTSGPTIKRKIKEDEASINNLLDKKRAIQLSVNTHVSDMAQRELAFEIFSAWYCDMPIKKIEERISFNKKVLFFLNETPLTGDINKNNILYAKTIPLNRILKISTGGFLKCIYHHEKTSSMKWYPKDNRVHCFGCGTRGDSIDVIQQLHKLDFQGAVKFIVKNY